MSVGVRSWDGRVTQQRPQEASLLGAEHAEGLLSKRSWPGGQPCGPARAVMPEEPGESPQGDEQSLSGMTGAFLEERASSFSLI